MRCTLLALALAIVSCSDSDPEDPAGGPDYARSDSGSRDDSGAGDDASTRDARVAQPGDSTCEVTQSTPEQTQNEPTTNTWSYDPNTRRLVATVYEYDLDEAGRTLRVYGRGSELTLYWTNHYDEHGNIDVNVHYTSGTFTYTNTYDGDQLVSVKFADPNGESYTTTYRYDDATVPTVWTRSEVDLGSDGSVENSTDRTIEAGRTATTKLWRDGSLHHQFEFQWNGDRIDTIERDGGYWAGDGPDGTPNIRFHWVRDKNGNVTEFTQDGTDSLDNPFVNGTPDFKETYSRGCAPLLKQFPWLAHEPASNSVRPRFRTDQE